MKKSGLWGAVFLLLPALMPAALFGFEYEDMIVSGIRTVVQDDRGYVFWNPPREEPQALLIYRSSGPIRDRTALTPENLAAALPKDKTEFSEALPLGGAYYAVIAVYESGPLELVAPLYNATVRSAAPATVEAEKHPAPGAESAPRTDQEQQKITGVRAAPLPALTQNTARSQPGEAPVPPGVKIQRLEAYIFPQEQTPSAAGEEFLLYDIISGPFAQKDYAVAAKRLSEFLQITRTKAITDRARFYQGECGYFLGDFRGAVNRFLDTKTAYPELSNRWLEASLFELKIP